MNKTHLLAIKAIIIAFLKKNGGYSNGYETVINATFRRNVMAQFVGLELPNSGNKTKNEMHKMENKLNEYIRKYLDDNNIDDGVKIQSHHIEHGCYEMHVSYTVSERISFI